MKIFTLSHKGLTVSVTTDQQIKGAAFLVRWPGNQALMMNREEAETLSSLLDLALDRTGPRQLVPVDLTGPDAPVFLRRQAD